MAINEAQQKRIDALEAKRASATKTPEITEDSVRKLNEQYKAGNLSDTQAETIQGAYTPPKENKTQTDPKQNNGN